MEIKIGVITTAWLGIPPKSYGGAEELTYSLIVGLQRLGVELVMFSIGETAKNPKIRQLGIPVGWHFQDGQYGQINDPFQRPCIETQHNTKGWQWLAKQHVDVILDHTGSPAFLEVASSTIALTTSMKAIPILHTLHSPPEGYRSFEKGVYFNLISNAQRRKFPFECIATIHNGIRVEEFPFLAEKKNYMLSIGRITPAKGQREAIEVARAAKRTLVIVGLPEDLEYWRTCILPNIDIHLEREGDIGRKWRLFNEAIIGPPKVVYWGAANFEEKVKLYKDAFCFLMLIIGEEPFGLVMIEAMACGTPVIAFKRDAVPEIIEHGETGFVVGNLDQAIEAVRGIDAISPEACRKRVEDHFNNMDMARKYLEVCHSILKKTGSSEGSISHKVAVS